MTARAAASPRARRCRRAARPTRCATAAAARTLARLPRPSSGVRSRAVPARRAERRPPSRRAPSPRTSRRLDVRRRCRCRRSSPGRESLRTRDMIRASLAFATSTRRARRRARGSRALASAIASADSKNPRCASPTLVHTRTSGSAMPDERADLARVIHPELDDRDVRRVAQLEQRQRQADVVVQIARVPEHAVARVEELRRHFLGRRLAGAAGDRHDRAAGAAPHMTRHVLQRHWSCPAARITGRRRRRPRAIMRRRKRSTSAPAAPRASASPRTDARRTARRGWRRRNRPACRLRESIEMRADRLARSALQRARRPSPPPPHLPSRSRSVHVLRDPRAERRRRSSAFSPRPRRRTAAPARRSPASSRDPCRRSAPDRPAAASWTAFSIAARRSTIARHGVDAGSGWPFGARSAGMTMPRLISSMMRAGSSERGLSEVTIDEVAEPRRHRAHQRPLGPIAIAAAAEHRDHAGRLPAAAPSPAGSSARRRCARSRRPPGRRQSGPETQLEAARNVRRGGDALFDRRRAGRSSADGRRDGGEDVVDVRPADERRAQRAGRRAASRRSKARPSSDSVRAAGANVGRRRRWRRSSSCGAAAANAAPRRSSRFDDAEGAGRQQLEQAPLDLEVLLHVAMEVEVIAGQVGEDGGGEPQRRRRGAARARATTPRSRRRRRRRSPSRAAAAAGPAPRAWFARPRPHDRRRVYPIVPMRPHLTPAASKMDASR